MNKLLKMTALLAVFASAGMHAEPEKVKVKFPEFLYECDYCPDSGHPCQLYTKEEDGTMFLWVKIDPTDPHAIIPNLIMVFRGQDYLVTDLQEFGQEDFAEVESAAECISIKMEPYK